ncbi:MAG: AAA family ATPase [Clostridia bacterium]|nr:AAA family ATPase [Clostridia bacterium]
MIIKKADIENFGKFSGRAIEFKPGFNLIFGNNEDGKSTLMSFIKMMFYGNSGKSGADISKNLRKKYSPWNGAPMSGAIEFETAEETIRLHKEFKKTSSSDKTTVLNMDTGEKQIQTTTQEAGEVFFDMELGEFERSVFVENFGGFSSDASGDSLAMRISNLSVSGDEGFSQSTVLSRIAAAKEELVSKNGKKGLLVDARARLESLEADLEKFFLESKAQFSLMSEISTLKNEISELENNLENITLAEKREYAQKELSILLALLEKIEKKQQLSKSLAEFFPDQGTLSAFISEGKNIKIQIDKSYSASSESTSAAVPDSTYMHLLDLERNIENCNRDTAFLNGNIKPAKENFENTLSSCKKKRQTFSVLLLALSVVLGIGSLSFFKFYVGVAVLLLGILGFACLFPQSTKKLSKNVSVRLAKQEFENNLRLLSFYEEGLSKLSITDIEARIQAEKSICQSEISQILEENKCSTIKELQSKTASHQNSQLASALGETNRLKQIFTLNISKFKEVTDFTQASTFFDEICKLSETLENLSGEIKTLALSAGTSDMEFDAIKHRFDSLKEFLDSSKQCEPAIQNPDMLKKLLLDKRSLLGELQSKIVPPSQNEHHLLSMIEETQDEIDRYTERFNALTLVDRAMEMAISEMNKGLGSHLSKKTGEYLSKMSGGKYSDVLVGRDLNIETRSNVSDGYHEWKFLSSGAIDRTYLALRLAATDIVAQKHNPLPLFMDDILAQYDDKCCLDTLKFLKDYFKESGSVSQVFFFTCHSHIRDMALKVFDDANQIIL